MAIVNTKALLKEYITGTLGAPIITVEITDTQLDNLIDTCIQKFTDFSMGGDTPKIYSFQLIPGINTYVLDNRVQAVTKVRTRSNSYNFQMPGVMVITPSEICATAMSPMGSLDMGNISAVMAKMSTLEKFFDVEPNYYFNFNDKVLEFFDTTSSLSYNHVIIEAFISYEPKPADMIYNHQWVKEYCVALAKRQWGSNIGKYNTTLINGASMNYDRIIAEGNTEMKDLDEQLLTRWSQPLGIHRA
jgi:hypothetical protein